MAACRGLLALALLCLWNGAAPAASRLIEAEGFALRLDDGRWALQTAAPPSLLTLHCISPACSEGNVVTFVRDERPLLAPGFAPFDPGAATGATADLRLQSLTPGSRLLARTSVEPVTVGGTTGYRGIYDIEDRSLAKTGAAILLLRQGHGTMEVRMSAPTLSKADIAAFDALLTGLELRN
ncbi:hypothetical protein LMIY3S_02542 [Labrys miyagiensis]